MKALLAFSLLVLSVEGFTSLPEEEMSAIEIIAYYGYPAEIITAETADGYILQMHRIPFGKNETVESVRRDRPIVFLQHGLLGSSADWVTNLPNQSAAFLFADAGFDVWMGNFRGNDYSTRHRNCSRSDLEYWKFSWDEMSKFDLEAMINKALSRRNHSSLYYVGHSQGTLTMFGKLANDAQFASKIKKFFALAPIGTVAHIKGMLLYIAKYLLNYSLVQKIFGHMEFLPNTWFSKLFSKFLCGFVYTNPLCDSVLFQIAGPETNQFNQTRLLVYLTHVPAGTSTQNIYHWAQIVASGKVQEFDFGSEEKNLLHYGKKTPPIYNLSNVDAPIYLYWSDQDWLADAQDVQETLLAQLPKTSVEQSVHLFDFNHYDFIWGTRAADEIYKKIVNVINENRTLKWG